MVKLNLPVFIGLLITCNQQEKHIVIKLSLNVVINHEVVKL